MSTAEASGWMREAAQVVFQAVHSIWQEWSQQRRSFPSERPEMQRVFRECLQASLPAGWSVPKPTGWSAGRSAFSQYDIGARKADKQTALLELALGDTNVAHALHNGELKLLANCDGVGKSMGKTFSVERGLTAGEVATIQSRLQQIPLRGLFFVAREPVLDVPRQTIWFETKQKGFSGETEFWSALFPRGGKATLCQVFQRLAEEGLHCWFYSLCREDSLECGPGPTPLCQRRPAV